MLFLIGGFCYKCSEFDFSCSQKVDQLFLLLGTLTSDQKSVACSL